MAAFSAAAFESTFVVYDDVTDFVSVAIFSQEQSAVDNSSTAYTSAYSYVSIIV